MSSYRENIWEIIRSLLEPLPTNMAHVLDFGSGDGWFARNMVESGLCDRLTAVDVKRRAVVYNDPIIIDPDAPLPFDDSAFDCAYAIDVLHHCHDPIRKLDELSRVSREYLLIKDHTYDSTYGQYALAILDEIGNRRFGIPSPHHYQKGWGWDEHLSSSGWERMHMIHPANCHRGALGLATNRLQFIALYRKDK